MKKEESKEPRVFDVTRGLFEMVKNEKPGDASGDVAMIFLPIALIIDIIKLPFDIYRWIRPKKKPEVEK